MGSISTNDKYLVCVYDYEIKNRFSFRLIIPLYSLIERLFSLEDLIITLEFIESTSNLNTIYF
jgi:hypothetical protein